MSSVVTGVENKLGATPGQVLELVYEDDHGRIRQSAFQVVTTADDYLWGYRQGKPTENLRFNLHSGMLQFRRPQTNWWVDMATVLEVGLACAVPLEVS